MKPLNTIKREIEQLTGNSKTKYVCTECFNEYEDCKCTEIKELKALLKQTEEIIGKIQKNLLEMRSFHKVPFCCIRTLEELKNDLIGEEKK